MHCHIVGGGQSPGTAGTSAFAQVTEQIKYLLTLHGAMPDLALTRSEIDDVITYIETLR